MPIGKPVIGAGDRSATVITTIMYEGHYRFPTGTGPKLDD